MIRNSLETLAEQEARIQSRVRSLSGSMDERFAQLRSTGTFDQYREIFQALVSLATAADPSLEALKRATFLAWYENVEPACFTGVAELPSDSLNTIADIIEPLAPNLDTEFRWMLARYFAITDYVFSDLDARPDLRTLLAAEDPDVGASVPIEADNLDSRGLMGDYWTSILESSAAGLGSTNGR